MSGVNLNYKISYAQNREDIILGGFFKDTKEGFYVDVGANDPDVDSVTKNFYDQGWSGINIEPILKYYGRLVGSRPRDINLNIAVASKEGEACFREYDELPGLSTLSKDSFLENDGLGEKDKRYLKYKEYQVQLKSLKQVFQENKVSVINFMKVDVEGFEYEVLVGNDWNRYRPQIVCVEVNHAKKDWRSILEKNGYSQVFFDGLNEYYISNEAVNSMEPFSYIETILPDPIVDYRIMGMIDYYKNERLKAESINADLNNKIFELQHQLYVTKESLHESMRFRGLAKGLANKINLIIEEIILPTKYRVISGPNPQEDIEIRLIESGSPEDILNSIKDYDRSLRNLNPRDHRFRYAALKIHRKVTMKGIGMAARGAKKALRGLKKRIK